jgi:hypothetical protein
MASANVLNNVMWQRDTSGHIALDKSSRKEFPFESVFAEDFDKVIQNLEGLQARISETTDGHNMIVSDKNIELVRFTWNIFEQRVRCLP